MTTPQIELRTESYRHREVLRRISQPATTSRTEAWGATILAAAVFLAALALVVS